MVFSKFKALLKKAAPRTMDDLWNAIANTLPMINPKDCRSYSAAAGCGAVQSESALSC
jgi:hypothetical protein